MPLIRIFVHPWVLHFQNKYKIERTASPRSAESSDQSENEQEDDSDHNDSKLDEKFSFLDEPQPKPCTNNSSDSGKLVEEERISGDLEE